MSAVRHIRTCLRKYVTFAGRASRTEFWVFQLSIVAVLFVLNVAAVIPERGASVAGDLFSLVMYLLWLLILAAVLLPSLAVSVRRLHDSNLSGLLVLVGLVPFIGWIAHPILMLLPGTPGPNRYGVREDQMPPAPTPRPTGGQWGGAPTSRFGPAPAPLPAPEATRFGSAPAPLPTQATGATRFGDTPAPQPPSHAPVRGQDILPS